MKSKCSAWLRAHACVESRAGLRACGAERERVCGAGGAPLEGHVRHEDEELGSAAVSGCRRGLDRTEPYLAAAQRGDLHLEVLFSEMKVCQREVGCTQPRSEAGTRVGAGVARCEGWSAVRDARGRESRPHQLLVVMSLCRWADARRRQGRDTPRATQAVDQL